MPRPKTSAFRRLPAPSVPLVSLALLAATSALAACTSSGNDQVTSPTALGMTNTLKAAYDDGEQAIYQVKTPVTLPYRQPTAAEANALGPLDPYPRTPFLLKTDVRIEVRYTLSNLDSMAHNVEVMLDPWNEFVHYVPGLEISDDDSLPDQSGYSKVVSLPAMSRLEGLITTDDMDELATDLATVEALQAHPPKVAGDDDGGGADLNGLMNHVFDPQNRSNSPDPLIAQYIPATVAGVTGFDLGLRTGEPAQVAIEITLEIQDLNGDRVLPYGSSAAPIPMPTTTITPPGAHPL